MPTKNAVAAEITARGIALDIAPDSFGELRRSNDVADDFDALRERMVEDGYLFLPGYLDRDAVVNVRRQFAERLYERGALDPSRDPMETVVNPAGATDVDNGPLGDVRRDFPDLMTLLYSGRVMDFYRGLLGGEVRHFDFTWMRVMGPGRATQPHCDIVYMGRGTTNLYTLWTPFSHITWDIGGLMILEDSHKIDKLRDGYGKKDVDAWCTNRKEKYEGMGAGGNVGPRGALSDDPVRIRARLGGRWLSTEYRMGDLLTFGMYVVHASIDNNSDRVRMSTDSRYQLASEPADERWIGENPIGHGEKAARGIIC